jgi:hypothetical protein
MTAVSTRRAIPAGAAVIPAIDDDRVCERIEEIILTLTTCYVREGFELDRVKASAALNYCRCQANGAPEDDRGLQNLIEFACENGQSLDWILRGDVRCMIASLASVKG